MRLTSDDDIGMRTLDIFINNAEEGPEDFVSRFNTLTNAKKSSLVEEILRASTFTDGCGSEGSNTGHCDGVPMMNTENIFNKLCDPKESNIFPAVNVLHIPQTIDVDPVHELVCGTDGEVITIAAGKQLIANDSIECIDLDAIEDTNTGNLALCFSNTNAVLFPTKFDNFFNNCNSADMDTRASCTAVVAQMIPDKSPLSSLPSLDDFLSVENEKKVSSRALRESHPGLHALVSRPLSLEGEGWRKAVVDPAEWDETCSNSQDGSVPRYERDVDCDLLLPGLEKDEHCVLGRASEAEKIGKEELSPCLLTDNWHEMLKEIIVEPDDCVHPFVFSADFEDDGGLIGKAV